MAKSQQPYAANGARLKPYVTERWPRSKGGIVGLAKKVNSTGETLHSYFRGQSEPSMGLLAAIARELGVSRWELVAVWDGAEVPGQAVDPRETDRRLRALELAVDALAQRAIEGPPARALPRVTTE